MRPIAQRGKGRSVLLEVAPGRGRVLDRDGRVLYGELSINSILARGYWQPFDGDADAVLAEARSAEELPPRERRPAVA